MRGSGILAGLGLIGALSAAAPGAAPPSTLTTLYSFGSTTSDGRVSVAGVVSDASGALYGTTEAGGSGTLCSGGCGTVYKLTPPPRKGGAWIEAVLYSFAGGTTDGFEPAATLLMDSTGALFGTTSYGGSSNCPDGCGTVFKLTPTGSGAYTGSVLYFFAGGTTDGALPFYAGLTVDPSGALYGTTEGGGAFGFGTVFKLTPGTGGSYTESVIHAFADGTTDGTVPAAGLITDSTGALYGTTTQGGAFGYGTVFKLTPATDGSYTESVLYSFAGGTTDGAFPYAGLIMDSTGAVYGTSLAGGLPSSSCFESTCGTVFKLTPAGGGSYTESVLYFFRGKPDGGSPFAGLVFGAKGTLLGTTEAGGAYGFGTVFKLNKKSESALYSFTGGTDGAFPFAGLLSGPNGALYGTTEAHGTGEGGTVFELQTK